MIHIIDNANHEWADARDLAEAVFAMKHIFREEKCDLRAVEDNGTVVAWCFEARPDEIGVVQRAR